MTELRQKALVVVLYLVPTSVSGGGCFCFLHCCWNTTWLQNHYHIIEKKSFYFSGYSCLDLQYCRQQTYGQTYSDVRINYLFQTHIALSVRGVILVLSTQYLQLTVFLPLVIHKTHQNLSTKNCFFFILRVCHLTVRLLQLYIFDEERPKINFFRDTTELLCLGGSIDCVHKDRNLFR